MATAQEQLTQAYQTYLGRAPEAGIIDWRVAQATKHPSETIAKQLVDIQNSPEAQKYKTTMAQQQAQASAGPPAPGSVGALSGDLAAMDKNYQAPIDVYNSAMESLGIPDARTRVSNLRGELMNTEALLKGVAESVAGRTRGTGMTEAKTSRLVNLEREPMMEQYGEIGNQMELASGDLQDLLGQATTQTELTVQGQQQQRQYLLDRLQLAIDQAKTADEKAKWQKEYDLQVKKFEEDIRQYNEKMAFDKAEAAKPKSTGGSTAKTATASTSQVFDSKLAEYAGGDGKVSPETYKSLRAQYVADYKGKGVDFDNLYWKKYVNESHWQDYIVYD